MIRLFAALPVPPDVAHDLARRQQGLPGARWRVAEQLHLTLAFFGEVRETDAADLDALLAGVRVEPFEVSLEGAGAFGEAADTQTLWAGVGPSESLTRLAAKCETAARRTGLAMERRAYRPHVTLAYLRGAHPDRIAGWLAEHNLLRSASWRATAFNLYSSWTSTEGSRYELERTYPLARPAPARSPGACPVRGALMTDALPRPRRSVLYMPASNQKAIDKARTLPCDAVILDLEDAVAPDAKETARALAVEAVRAGGFGRREVAIRVNGLETPWGEADLRAAAEAGPDAVLVPKVSDGGEVARYDSRLSHAPEHTRLWTMIETARALFHLDGIGAAAKTSRLACWVMGTNDLAKETGARLTPGRGPFYAALGLSVAAARAHGVAILDGVFNGLEDDAGLERECMQGLEFGFDGKTLIHPRQVEIANRIFTPAPEEVAFARAVIDAYSLPENAAKGAIRVDGKMAERLHLAQAIKLVALADATVG